MPDSLPFGPTALVVAGLVTGMSILWKTLSSRDTRIDALSERLIALGEKTAIVLEKNTTVIQQFLDRNST